MTFRDEVSVERIAAPHYAPELHEWQGQGWVIDAYGVRFSDGVTAVHCTYSFGTRAEAEAFSRRLRGKMT